MESYIKTISPILSPNLRISIVYIISIVGLFLIQQKKPQMASNYPHTLKFVQIRRNLLEKKLNKNQANLILAYTLGDKSEIGRIDKKQHKNLNLLHLFTPSGIHFSAIAFILLPIIILLKNLNSYLPSAIHFFGYLFSFMIPGYWSIKRIILIKAIILLPKKIDLFIILIVAFFIDFIFGTYQHSPVSFLYSFLFLGVIFNIQYFPKISFIYFIFIAQLIVCYFQNTEVYILGPIFGIIITALFSICFPFFVTPIIFGSWVPTFLYKWPLVFLSKTIAFLSKFVGLFGHLSPSLPLILLCIILIFSFHKKMKNLLVILLLMMHSNAILNLPKNSIRLYNGKNNEKLSQFKVLKAVRKNRSLHIKFDNGIQCRMTLFNNYYRDNCY